MHNQKGFSKEIYQLKATLRERQNEYQFLSNELSFFKKDLQNLIPGTGYMDFIAIDNMELEFDDLSFLVQYNYENNQENRMKLRDTVLRRIEINENLFELSKRAKVLEGKVFASSAEQLDTEKKFWSDRLRHHLSMLENKRNKYSGRSADNLKSQISQNERLRLAMHSLLDELNNKIAFVQNKVYAQSMTQLTYSPEPLQRSSMKHYESMTTKSMQYSLKGQFSAYSEYKDNKYHVIIPSPLELKNLIPKSHLENVIRVGESTFELNGQRFKFLRDVEGNTYINPKNPSANGHIRKLLSNLHSPCA